jgi:hypothetical protein
MSLLQRRANRRCSCRWLYCRRITTVIRVDCSTSIIAISLPLCASAPTRATLSRQDLSAIVLEIAAPNATGSIELTVPPTTLRGVYMLKVQSDCGCFEAAVFVDTCNAPAIQSRHIPTFPPTQTPECCLPEGVRVRTGVQVIIESTRMLLAPYPASIAGKAFTARDTSGRQIATGIVTIDSGWAVLAGEFPNNNIYLEIVSP